MRFPYRRYPITPSPAAPEAEFAYRPVVPVRIVGSKNYLDLFALVDSGADETYITQEMAGLVGADVCHEGEGVIQSASGQTSAWYTDLCIELQLNDEIVTLNTTVGVIDQPWDEAILGHIGFLEHFTAIFSYKKKWVDLVTASEQETLNT